MEREKTWTIEHLDEALNTDHRALEQTLRHMLTTMAGEEPEAIRAAWQRVDRQLRAHLQAEEDCVLRSFEQHFPHEAMRVRKEHAQIRGMLDALEVDLDLHALSKARAAEFVELLRDHAAYEERVFYPWAQAHVTGGARRSLIETLRVAKALLSA